MRGAACCCSPWPPARPPSTHRLARGARCLVRGRGALLAAAPRRGLGRAPGCAVRALVAGADAVGAEVADDLALLGVAAVDGTTTRATATAARTSTARRRRASSDVSRAPRKLPETRVSAADAFGRRMARYDCVAACGSGRVRGLRALGRVPRGGDCPSCGAAAPARPFASSTTTTTARPSRPD